MALQGTIDSFPLSDVLALLSASAKSGCLSLKGDRGHGMLWIDNGEVVTGSIDGRDVDDASNLVFELLRFHDAEFAFDDRAEAPPAETEPESLAACVHNAAELLERWEAIEVLIPSDVHRIALVGELSAESVTIDAEVWPLIVAAGRGTTLRDVCIDVGLDEFRAGAELARLVEAGVLDVGGPIDVTQPEPASEPAPEQASESALEPFVEPPAAVATEPTPELEQSHLTDFLAGEEESTDGGFPERFPIDDLIGDEDASQELWREPLTVDHGERESSTAAAWDEIVEESHEPDGTDEVLRQMSKLSPQAAEAIAAALNSPATTESHATAESPAPAEPPEEPTPGPEGPVTFLGSF